MTRQKMLRYDGTIGFSEVLAYIKELHPNLTDVQAKPKAKTLYDNLFFGARKGHLNLDFVCAEDHDIKTCRCTGKEFRGEWQHDLTAATVAATWRIGVKSLVNIREEQLSHFQVQTAGNIRAFADYISKRSRR